MTNAAISIFNRLSRMEKIDLCSASQDRIAHLAHDSYLGDMNIRDVAEADREAVLTEVRQLAHNDFKSRAELPL